MKRAKSLDGFFPKIYVKSNLTFDFMTIKNTFGSKSNTNMSEKLDKGKEGEEYAVKYLVDKGYLIKERNFTSQNSEIDIICSKDDMLVFVEVRLKVNADYGFPEGTMGKGKQNAVKRGAEAYLLKFPWHGEARFDFISIIEKPQFEILHFEDAFF
ncbi:COG0792 Predicted endonuclease distantly related to archaeal Holliday junction resolvase [Spirosomataceae bacterium]|jgi:putative endonuclease